MESKEKIIEALIKYIAVNDLSVSEAAERLKISASSLYGYLDGKEINKKNKAKLMIKLKDYM